MRIGNNKISTDAATIFRIVRYAEKIGAPLLSLGIWERLPDSQKACGNAYFKSLLYDLEQAGFIGKLNDGTYVTE